MGKPWWQGVLLFSCLALWRASSAQPLPIASCSLNITGDGAGIGLVIQNATMVCTGAPVFMMVDDALSRFKINFTGVGPGFGLDPLLPPGGLPGGPGLPAGPGLPGFPAGFDPSLPLPPGLGPPGCMNTSCLISLCGPAKMSFTNSNIVGVGAPNLAGILCMFESVSVDWTGTIASNVARNATIIVKDIAKLGLIDSVINNNRVRDGALMVQGPLASATVTHTTFAGNWATASGAGIHVAEGASVSAVDSVFAENNAIVSGGAIFARNASKLTVLSSQFNGNHAVLGAAVAMQDQATATLGNASMWNNTGYSGAALRVQDTARATVTSSKLTGNLARNDGGGACTFGSGQLSIINSTLSGNSALQLGGAISAQGNGSLSITGTEITDNTAPVGGGMAAFFEGSVLRVGLVGGRFANNSGSLKSVKSGPASGVRAFVFIQDDCTSMGAQVCRGFDLGVCYQAATALPAASVHVGDPTNVCIASQDKSIAIALFSTFAAAIVLALVLVSFHFRKRHTRPGPLEEVVAKAVRAWQVTWSSPWGRFLSAMAQAGLLTANLVTDSILAATIFPDSLWVLCLAVILAPQLLATLLLHLRLVQYTTNNDGSVFPTLLAYKLHAQLSEWLSRFVVWPVGLVVLWPFLLVGDIPMMLANLASGHVFSWLHLYNYLWLHSFFMLIESVTSACFVTWAYYSGPFFLTDTLYGVTLATSLVHISVWVCPLIVACACGTVTERMRPIFCDLVGLSADPPAPPSEARLNDTTLSIDGVGHAPVYDVGALVDDYRHTRNKTQLIRALHPEPANDK